MFFNLMLQTLSTIACILLLEELLESLCFLSGLLWSSPVV